MARLRMLANVTVNGKGWSTRYLRGRYYSENHREFLKSHPESFEVVEDKRNMDIFDVDEPDLVDDELGIE